MLIKNMLDEIEYCQLSSGLFALITSRNIKLQFDINEIDLKAQIKYVPLSGGTFSGLFESHKIVMMSRFHHHLSSYHYFLELCFHLHSDLLSL